eukprot:34873-Pleurochrysis_carterae.AAC.1
MMSARHDIATQGNEENKTAASRVTKDTRKVLANRSAEKTPVHSNPSNRKGQHLTDSRNKKVAFA